MAEDVKQMGYKGFAYIKGNDKPYVLYGNSQTEIINRLQGYNRARSPELVYRNVNIGTLDPNQDKYINYHKYEVATGKDITSVYLHLPVMEREDFRLLTAQLKEEGAKYNAVKKSWYITQEQADNPVFAKYLQPDQKPVQLQQYVSEIIEEAETPLADQALAWKPKHEMVGFSDRHEITVTLQDQSTVTLDATKFPEEYWQSNALEKLQYLDSILDEHIQHPDQASEQPLQAETEQNGYVLDVSRDIEKNECTIFFHDGRDPVHLYGDQLGVSFPQLDRSEAEDVVNGFLENQSDYQVNDRLDYAVGHEFKGYMLTEDAGALEEIHGTVIDANDKQVMIKLSDLPEDQAYQFYDKNMLLTESQKNAVQDIFKIARSEEEIRRICDPAFTSAQQEQMISGIKDRLTEEAVKVYTDPKLKAWQMDLYRIGLQHGVSADEIRNITQSGSDWITARRQMTGAINMHRQELGVQIEQAGFKPNQGMVRKMEQLNHLTGKYNSMKDVCKAYKEHLYRDTPDIDRLVKEIGNECRIQEAAKLQIPVR